MGLKEDIGRRRTFAIISHPDAGKPTLTEKFLLYGGAVHSFTRPDAGSDNSKGAAYNEHADKRSWEAMKEFFAEIFR